MMSAQNNPLISIIIPCYNLSGFLEPCLNSCILQTYNNLEIIVLNDGSLDDTKNIIDYYAQLDSRIVPINKNNEGVAKTRKTGIEKSSGDYIFFLDGDDYIPIDAIEILVKKILDNNSDIVIGNIFKETQNGFQEIIQVDDKQDFILKIVLEELYALWGKLYSRNLFDNTLCYHLDLKRGEDDSLLIQLINKASKITSIDKTIYFYRYRGGAVTKEVSNKHYLDNYKATFIIEEYAIQYGLTLNTHIELGLKMCNAINYIVQCRKNQKLDSYCENKVKEKIKNYLVENKVFAKFYFETRNKNYKRLIFYYRYPFMSEKVFSILYKMLNLLYNYEQ